MSDDDIDPARVPFEIQRSMDRDYGLLPEMVTPGLMASVDEEADVVRFTERHGREVATVPRYRLRAVDEGMLLAAATRDEPSDTADQIAAAIHGGQWAAPPDLDYVTIDLGPGRSMNVGRCLCVPDWPEDSDDGHVRDTYR
jgi:hypothetical protein